MHIQKYEMWPSPLFYGGYCRISFLSCLEVILVLFFVTLLLSSLCLQRAFKRMWGKNLHFVVVRLEMNLVRGSVFKKIEN